MTYINRRTGLVVTVLSETPTFVTFSVKGGGFVCRVPKILFQADFEPQEVKEPTWRKAWFTWDGAERKWEGYTRWERWNGWECPMFTLEVAQDIAALTQAEEGDKIVYAPDKDCFIHTNYGDTEGYPQTACSTLIDGRFVRLYEVADGWCWEEWVPEPEVRPELAFIKEPIDSEQAAKNYLRQLHRTGFAFHPEDDPIDIERSGEPLFNGAEMEHLAARQAELFKHLQDPCAYALFVGMGFQAYGRESDAASTPTWQDLVNLEVGEQLPAYPNLWIRRIS